MSVKTVDDEALTKANIALQKYIGSISDCINNLQSVAKDCSDNMGKDVYSKRAIEELQKCINDIRISMKQAEEVRQKIIRKHREIVESGNSF